MLCVRKFFGKKERTFMTATNKTKKQQHNKNQRNKRKDKTCTTGTP